MIRPQPATQSSHQKGHTDKERIVKHPQWGNELSENHENL